ncbi:MULTISPECIES: hypothetical protein [Sphingobium]|uniref:Uncharacterized protein n=1 Tax=Sphingobium psychrophilum TaxID=2728834 RepID=A0A7X9WZH5_9SPHN|nr:hypothetical protein [Sphingobium psychrophilum]NML12724.1 hypothetical protein [Sphingobium psychrophilum]
MAAQATRSYRLTMSECGLSLFLQCHSRFCTAAHDLLSYGNTLHAAVTLLAARDLDEMVADLADPDIARLSGTMQHYVGAPQELGSLAREIREKVSRAGAMYAPPLSTVYVAAVSHMSVASERDMRRLCALLRRPQSA